MKRFKEHPRVCEFRAWSMCGIRADAMYGINMFRSHIPVRIVAVGVIITVVVEVEVGVRRRMARRTAQARR